MKKILVIGSLNMDIVMRVNRMPLVGETVIGESMVYNPGGKGANQACAAGRLAGDVSMLGCVGDDDFGAELIHGLSRAGVDIGRIRRSSTQPTGTAVISVNSDGDNSIVVIPGANLECDIAYLKENDDILRQSDYILLQMEIPHDAVWHAIRRARELGKTAILNPAPAPDEIPRDVLETLDYISPNETELAHLAGDVLSTRAQIESAAEKLAGKGVRGVLVTLGSQGCLLSDSEKSALFPATDMKPVDTTAAGDCFNAAFVVALAEGKSPEQAVVFANVAGGIAVTRQGAQPSLPTRAEVDQYLGSISRISS